jgi:hypothetical protein
MIQALLPLPFDARVTRVAPITKTRDERRSRTGGAVRQERTGRTARTPRRISALA